MIHRKYFSCESQPQSCKVAIYSLQLTFLGKMQVVLRVREAINKMIEFWMLSLHKVPNPKQAKYTPEGVPNRC